MPEFRVDRRDLEFVLFEQVGAQRCLEYDAYREMNKETLDLVFNEVIKMGREVLGPINGPADRKGFQVEDGNVLVSEEFHHAYRVFREGGWFAPSSNPDFGGMGLPISMCVALADVFTGAFSAFMNFSGLTASGAHLIECFGSKKLQDLMVERLYTGEWMGTMCLTEPQAGSAVGDISTRAEPIEQSDQYRIRGNKIFITAGDSDLPENIIHLILARVEGDVAGTKGISLFAVPKYHLGPNGEIGERNDVTLTGVEHKMGLHASPTCSLAFGEKGDCRGWLIGEQSKGIVYMFQMMNEARLLTGAQGSGLANAAYQYALHYAKERVQGAKLTDRSSDATPVAIIEHPDVRRNLMMAKSIAEGIRVLLLQTAVYGEDARNHPDEGVRGRSQDLMDFLTPICKAYASDQGFKVTELAIQVLGGYGYISEYGVEQTMRDSKITSIYEGTNGIQAMDLLGRKMRLKGGALFMTWLQEVTQSLEGVTSSLEAEVAAVNKAKEVLGGVAMHLQATAQADLESAFLNATPFLEMCGHVEVARLLLGGAHIATGRLGDILQKAEVPSEERASFMKSHAEARFYDAKVKTAKFFVNSVIPHVRATANGIQSGDRSALDIVF